MDSWSFPYPSGEHWAPNVESIQPPFHVIQTITWCASAPSPALTVVPQGQRGGRPQDLVVGHRVGDHAGVVPHVGLFHLRDVQVPGLLGDEAAVVLVGGVFVEDPGVAQLWKPKERSLPTRLLALGPTALLREVATLDTHSAALILSQPLIINGEHAQSRLPSSDRGYSRGLGYTDRR